ncbi:MAG: hypothetical protein AB8F78_10925 [Saprospiraceae bacterium]
MDTVTIVDFDNLAKPQSDVAESERVISGLIDNLVSRLAWSEGENTLLIRLYGGWYEDDFTISRRGSIVMQALSEYRGEILVDNELIIRIKIEIAGSLATERNVKIRNTYVQKEGMKNLRVKPGFNSECSHSNQICPAKFIKKLSASALTECMVEGCSSINSEIFIQYGQKQVDTHMASDILIYSLKDDAISRIVVITADVDIIPPVASALELSSVEVTVQVV